MSHNGCKTKKNAEFPMSQSTLQRNMNILGKTSEIFIFLRFVLAVKPASKHNTAHTHSTLHTKVSFTWWICSLNLRQTCGSRGKSWKTATRKKDFLSSSTSFSHHTPRITCCNVSHVLYINLVDLVALPLRHSGICSVVMEILCENFPL